MTALSAGAQAALEEVRVQYDGVDVEVEPDGAGGAFVVVPGRDPGPPYAQRDSWLGFHLSPLVPDADVYPHYVRGDLVRVDGRGHGPAVQPMSWRGRSSLQISLRSNRRDVSIDTAALKAERVLSWLASQ